MTPLAVMTKISSSSLTIQKQLMRSVSSTACLNLIAMTPTRPRPVERNSSVATRLPYPSDVTHRTNSFPLDTLPFKTFISAMVSFSRSFIEITPRLVRPVGRSLVASKRVAIPRDDPIKISSPSRQWWHHFNLSPSDSEAMVKPRPEIFSNASNDVFFIHPCSVANTMYSSLENSVTGSTAVTTWSTAMGSTDGSGAPLAVLDPMGT
mmetsp:Transcript_27724/g.42706  ORF Transcript_27724/g.42706 Transcript_27724/m.42706 type:complete len:207 (-) Transcript_27724:134-754(-)